MNIVIDANIIISALIKDSLTRKIILKSNCNFLFPELGIEEIYRYKNEIIQKSKLSENDFNILLLRLFKNIRIIPTDLIISKREEANKIMEKIDKNDAIFIATALTFNCQIWSEDKHFKMQKSIKTFTTKEILDKVNC